MPRWLVNLGILALAFGGATGVAEILGAPNTGTAMTFGQLAFVAALVFVLLRRE